jgi:hypothetical protein
MMIDLILLAVFVGVAYGGFMAGAKYKTVKLMAEAVLAGWNQ